MGALRRAWGGWRAGAAAACVLALAAGCTGGSPGAAPSPSGTGRSTPRLVFSDCATTQFKPEPSPGRALAYSCGTLAVPVDPAVPGGPTVAMFVVRVRMAGQRDRIGSLVFNPGGPGASGVGFASYLASRLPEELLRRFDLVSFDPRGVGRSDPVRCVPKSSGSVDGYRAALAKAVRTANSCYAKYGDRLADYNTTAVAHDMELLRQALTEPKLTYLGSSYGTLLGAVYATLYPDRVRAFVLDGAVDPTAGELSNQEYQARGFEDAFNRFAADCVRRQCPLGRDPRAFLTRLLATAKASPIPDRRVRRPGKATDDTVLDVVSSALYARGWWPFLSAALYDADRGDAAALFTLRDNLKGPPDPHDNFDDAYLTIRCVDKRDRITEAQTRTALTDWTNKYPLFGRGEALSLLDCQQWKAPQRPPPAVHAATASPILVVGTRHDPATPYRWAQRLRLVLGNADLLTWDGDGHTAYPMSTCIDDAVDRYLIAGTIPHRTCPAA